MKKLAYALLLIPNAVLRASMSWSTRPVFLDVRQSYPALNILQEHCDEIKAEFLAIRNVHQAPRYHEVDSMQKRISQVGSDDSGNWRVFFLEAMGHKAANRATCPTTARLLDSIPGVFQACFSILEKSTSVPSHRSPYNGYLRYHLALQVPAENRPRMRVKDQWVEWQEGHGFLFDDTWEHEIVNTSQSTRVVLIVDVLRPMPLLAQLVNRTVMFVMRHTYARRIIKRSELALLS